MTKAVPDGTHTLTPHLVVQNASAAIDFYKRAFGAEELMRLPSPDGKTIVHACLKIGDSQLMLADEMAGCQSPQSVGGISTTIHLAIEDADAAMDRCVKAGATVTMPLMDAFWGDRYGRIKDPFGHEWSIASHQKDLTPEEINEAAKEFFAQMPGSPPG